MEPPICYHAAAGDANRPVAAQRRVSRTRSLEADFSPQTGVDAQSLPADRPKLHFQAGEITRNMECEAPRGLHRLPVWASAIEFEIGSADMEGDLARSDR